MLVHGGASVLLPVALAVLAALIEVHVA